MTFPDTRTVEALLNLPGASGQTIDLAHKYLDAVEEWNAELLLPDQEHEGQKIKDLRRTEAEELCRALNQTVQTHWTLLMEAKAV